MAKARRNRKIRMQAAALIKGNDHKHDARSEFPGIEHATVKTVARRIRRVGFIAGTKVERW